METEIKMIHKMMDSLKSLHREEILEYMANQYVDAGRATPLTAQRLAETEYKYASDDEIYHILMEIGVLTWG